MKLWCSGVIFYSMTEMLLELNVWGPRDAGCSQYLYNKVLPKMSSAWIDQHCPRLQLIHQSTNTYLQGLGSQLTHLWTLSKCKIPKFSYLSTILHLIITLYAASRELYQWIQMLCARRRAPAVSEIGSLILKILALNIPERVRVW